MNINDCFDKDLVLFIDDNDQEEVLKTISSILINKGYVKESYCNAILEREKIFPTGLSTEFIGVAIPHTDSIHVNKEAIAVGILKNDTKFFHMGTEDEGVEVRIVFMLAIKNPEEQLKTLQMIIELIQDSDVMKNILECTTVEELYSIISSIDLARGV